LDSAGLAPSADLDLGLNHARITDVVGRVRGLVDGLGMPSERHGNAVAGEQLLALILKEIHARLHSSRSRAAVTGRPRKRLESVVTLPMASWPRDGDPEGSLVRHVRR